MLNKKIANFKLTVKICRGHAPSQKATFQSEILELGSCTNLSQHEMCPIFFSKIPPSASVIPPPPKKIKFHKLSCLDPLSEILKGHLSSLNKHSNQLMTTTTTKLVIEDDILLKVNSATSRRLRPAKYDVFTREPSFTRTWDYMILTALNGLFF